MENPYTGILQIMREQGSKLNPPSISMGTVITKHPLTIKTGDLVLEYDDLVVNYDLISDDNTSPKTTRLKDDDTVLMLPMGNNQQYIIIGKVVEL